MTGMVFITFPLPATQFSRRSPVYDLGMSRRGRLHCHGNYAYIVVFFNRSFHAVTGTEMAVARSSDTGHTWTSTFFNINSGPASSTTSH
jgi:hypothetical protein